MVINVDLVVQFKTSQNKVDCLYSNLKVEILLLYVPTRNKFKRIQFRINNASVQHFFHVLLLLLL